MLRCYLDDSGSNKQAPYATMAGYVSYLAAWDRFEAEARSYLRKQNVQCVHAREFYNTDGEFKLWSGERKADFLDGLFRIGTKYIAMGVSQSTFKATHASRKVDTGLGKNQSPVGFAFVGAMNLVLADEKVGRDAKWDGIAFVLEDGNKNNSGIIKSYGNIRQQHNAKFLKSISVVGKRDCVAIQMADLLAFFSRRRADQTEVNNRQPVKMDRYLEIMLRSIRSVGGAATDFGGH